MISAPVPSATMLALADQHDPVGVLVGLLEVVRREQHGAALRGVLPDRGPERRGALDVHAGGGLVEQQQRRVGQQRHREPQPLLLTAGALATLRSAMPVMPASRAPRRPGGCRRTGWRCTATVSRTVRSLSSPPVCITALTSPRATACRGCIPSTSTVPVVGLREARAPCRWSWSCRRRWARGRPPPRRAGSPGRCPGPPCTVAEVLGHPGQPDCGGVARLSSATLETSCDASSVARTSSVRRTPSRPTRDICQDIPPTGCQKPSLRSWRGSRCQSLAIFTCRSR